MALNHDAEHFNYAELSYRNHQHFLRFQRRVEATKLVCQECGGAGGETVAVLDYGAGPWEPCGWCEGTGYLTPWLRGLWLRSKRKERQHGPI